MSSDRPWHGRMNVAGQGAMHLNLSQCIQLELGVEKKMAGQKVIFPVPFFAQPGEPHRVSYPCPANPELMLPLLLLRSGRCVCSDTEG